MQQEKLWTSSKITKLFRTDISSLSLIRAEENGKIPEAVRLTRGSIQARAWKQSDLPDIGRIYGFLKEPKETQVVAVYTAKGGVLKTTFSYNLARTAALNGIKTLVIGLDVQSSITDLLSYELDQYETLEDIKTTPGLYDVTGRDPLPIEQVIQVSDLPTLHYIPESIRLNFLEQSIRDAKKREHFLERLIEPLKSKYKLIIFDNAPSWSFLIQNALAAANHVVSPIGCDVGSFKSVTQNIEIITQFQEEMGLQWQSFSLIPTLREKTKLSSQIEAQYRQLYPDFITTNAIKRAATGQESAIRQSSVFESDPNSSLAHDYFEILTEVWSRIAGA